MIPKIPSDPAKRDQRKADLILASELLRVQTMDAVDDLGQRADLWGRRWLWVKGWMSDPLVLAAGGGIAAFFASSGRRRRGQFWRAGRWLWMAWKLLGKR